MCCARFAASWSPSPAATIDPFIKMCHCRANASGSATPASGHERPNASEVFGARVVQDMGRVADLQQHVDERTAFEVGLAEPLVENVEDGQQAFAGIARALLDCALEPVFGPALLAPFEERQHQRIFGREVSVQGHACDAGLLDDGVDADGANAAT